MSKEFQPANHPPDIFSEARSNSQSSEDLALAILRKAELSSEEIDEIRRNASPMKSRKVRMALASHPRAPRRVSLKLIREFYTFELVQFALCPTVPADLKHFANELLISHLDSITLGERISLAHRSSTRVAAALILDKEARVWRPALENPRLTEQGILRALTRGKTSPAFVEALCRHSKWSRRTEIRVALLRHAHTPLARALEFTRGIPPAQLRDVLHSSHLPRKIKDYLRKEIGKKP